MAVKGRYVADPDLDEDGLDTGLFDNDPGFYEVPDAPGSPEELDRFEFLAKHKTKPEDYCTGDEKERKRYAKFLKKKGINPAGVKSK
jgi:hypothetical protein